MKRLAAAVTGAGLLLFCTLVQRWHGNGEWAKALIEADGALVFGHACKLGLEGIVSKRKASAYRSGPSRDWLKSKNPTSEAVRREAFEDWGRRRRRHG